jgi:hypothetical protein
MQYILQGGRQYTVLWVPIEDLQEGNLRALHLAGEHTGSTIHASAISASWG